MNTILTEGKIEMRRLDEIKPYVRNPRNNAKTVELLCNLIPKVGFNVPIVIDEKGIIVKGHARFAAAIRLGMDEVPCIVSHADEEAIKADRITDNKISEYSEWMDNEVLQQIEEINTEIDFSELGFALANPEEMPTSDQLIGSLSEPDFGEPEVKREKARYFKCTCPDCGHVMFVKPESLKRGEPS